jgi:chromosome segregation ATPase
MAFTCLPYNRNSCHDLFHIPSPCRGFGCAPTLSRAMSTVETLESLQVALEPLEVLQNEQVELGAWIHDSFSALEKLHEELTQWQSELARKETELDLRQDAIGKSKTAEKGLQKLTTQLEQQLAASQLELQQLEEENGEQLQEYEKLEARFTQLEVDCQVVRQRNAELEAALAAERKRTASTTQQCENEIRELRNDFEKHFQQLAEQIEKVSLGAQEHQESNTPLSAGAAHAKSAELRRRAQSRREAKRKDDNDNQD